MGWEVSRKESSMQRLGLIPAFVAALTLTFAAVVHAATWEEQAGPQKTVLISEAGPAGDYYIRRPEKLSVNAHPVAVLLVGWGSHPKRYDALLDELASHGVVAIAHSSSDQGDGTKANAALNWLLEQNEISASEYFHKLIPSRILAIGHSAGGNGAVRASIHNPRITSVLLYSPSLSLDTPVELRVPAFFIAAALDGAVPPAEVKGRYELAIKAPAWFGVSENQGHTGYVTNSTVQYYTRAWVYTQLYDDTGSARNCFYGSEWTLQRAPGWSEALKNGNAP
jgi:dienelactone hydrolase